MDYKDLGIKKDEVKVSKKERQLLKVHFMCTETECIICSYIRNTVNTAAFRFFAAWGREGLLGDL